MDEQLGLDADPEAAIVVLGDFNDGPGRDLFEQQYLAHNVTDLLVGSPYRPETLFGAWAAHRTGDGERRDERATDHRPATVVVET